MIRTFWEIEQEKTWKIYLLLAVLFIFYSIPIYLGWLLIKFIISVRYEWRTFDILGWDTLAVLVISAGATLLHWYFSSGRVTERVLRLLRAKTPDHHDRYHHVFQNIVDEIEVAAGGIKVERYVIPTSAMNAFAVADLGGRKVVGVTEGLLSRLDRAELTSVVAHEMAHIASGDSLITTLVCAMFAVYGQILDQFNRAGDREIFGSTDDADDRDDGQKRLAGAAFAVPMVMIVALADMLSGMLNMLISRAKEYRADAAAVRYSRDPMALARALYKISQRWRGAGFGGEHLSAIFILSPGSGGFEEQEGFVADLFSTHPPVRQRLKVLLDMGHSTYDELGRQSAQERVRSTAGTGAAPAVTFKAERDGQWLGPFTVLQLMSLEWLMPDTLLMITGREEKMKADEIADLRSYFSAREDPLWKIRRICPVCREWMIIENYEGLNLHFCPFCHGYLVDRDALPRIIVRRERGFTEQVVHLAEVLGRDSAAKHPGMKLLLDTACPRLCAKCGRPMVHRLYSYAYHIEIDECQRCNMIWFDPEELEVLQCLIERAEQKK